MAVALNTTPPSSPNSRVNEGKYRSIARSIYQGLNFLLFPNQSITNRKRRTLQSNKVRRVREYFRGCQAAVTLRLSLMDSFKDPKTREDVFHRIFNACPIDAKGTSFGNFYAVCGINHTFNHLQDADITTIRDVANTFFTIHLSLPKFNKVVKEVIENFPSGPAMLGPLPPALPDLGKNPFEDLPL